MDNLAKSLCHGRPDKPGLRPLPPAGGGWEGGTARTGCLPSVLAILGFPPPRLPPLGGGKTLWRRCFEVSPSKKPPLVSAVRAVLKRLGDAASTVRYHFPDLCRTIARQYAEHRARCATVRKAHAAEEVRRVAYQLHAKGLRLTRQNIRPLLTSSDYLNLPEGRAALREVRSQLGL